MTLEEQRDLRSKAYNIAIAKLKELNKTWGWLYEDANDSDDIKEVKRLIKQFNYGIAAQNELLNKCIQLGWISYEQNT